MFSMFRPLRLHGDNTDGQPTALCSDSSLSFDGQFIRIHYDHSREKIKFDVWARRRIALLPFSQGRALLLIYVHHDHRLSCVRDEDYLVGIPVLALHFSSTWRQCPDMRCRFLGSYPGHHFYTQYDVVFVCGPHWLRGWKKVRSREGRLNVMPWKGLQVKMLGNDNGEGEIYRAIGEGKGTAEMGLVTLGCCLCVGVWNSLAIVVEACGRFTTKQLTLLTGFHVRPNNYYTSHKYVCIRVCTILLLAVDACRSL